VKDPSLLSFWSFFSARLLPASPYPTRSYAPCWHDLRLPGAVSLLVGAVLGVVFALVALPVQAQVNTEKMRALDVNGFATTVGGDVAIQSGNADLFELGARLRFDARQQRHYGFVVGLTRYGEEDGETFRDRSFLHLRYTYRVLPWLVPETFTQFEENGFTLLQLRILYGLGVRFRYVDTERFKLFQGTTPMLEYENLNGRRVTVHPATVQTVRWSNYLNLRLRLTDNTYLIQTVYVQPRLDEINDVRVLDEATLAVQITKSVALQVGFNLTYDSRPPDGVEDLDVSLRNGLTVTF